MYNNCPKFEDPVTDTQFTSTVDCIYNLVRGRIFVIAGNQRPYEWTEEEMEKLLTDICDAWDSGETVYFLSSILLKNNGSNIRARINVVDGQQRLTSICILLAAIRSCISTTIEKQRVTKFLRGNRDETEEEHLLKTEHDKNSTFFADYIMSECPFPKEIEEKVYSETEDIDDIVGELEKKGITTTISSKNMAYNFILTLRFLKKNFQTEDTTTNTVTAEQRIINLFSFIKYGCSFVITTIQNDSELKIFNTLNRRGRPLSDMDTLKTEFIDKFKGLPQDKLESIDKWNIIHQELGEKEFGLIMESISVVLEKEKLEEIVQQENTILFIKHFLDPLYNALKCIRNKAATGKLRKELEIFHLLHSKHYLLKSKDDDEPSNKCTLMMILLVALYNSIDNSTELFKHSNQWENTSSLAFVLDLIRMWNSYLLKLCINSSSKAVKSIIVPTLEPMLNTVREMLVQEKKAEKPNYSLFKVGKNNTCYLHRVEGQEDQSSFLTPFFGIYLKIIKIDQDFEKDPDTSCPDLEKLEAKQIYSKIDGDRPVKNKLKQIGNFALCPIDVKEIKPEERNEIFKKWNNAILEIPSENNLQSELDQRTQTFSQYIIAMAENEESHYNIKSQRKTSLGSSSTPKKPTEDKKITTPVSDTKKEKKKEEKKKEEKKKEEKKRKREEGSSSSSKKNK